MKFLEFAEEHLKNLNDLCHLALKGAGIDAYQCVKKLEVWLSSVQQPPTSEKTDESKPG